MSFWPGWACELLSARGVSFHPCRSVISAPLARSLWLVIAVLISALGSPARSATDTLVPLRDSTIAQFPSGILGSGVDALFSPGNRHVGRGGTAVASAPSTGTAELELLGRYSFDFFAWSLPSAGGRLFYGDLETGKIQALVMGTNELLELFAEGIGEDPEGELYVLGSMLPGPAGTAGTVLKRMPGLPAVAACLVLSCIFLARRRRSVVHQE